MSGPRRSALLVVVLVAALTNCSCGPAASTSRPAGIAVVDDRLVLEELDQLWSNTGQEAGGYRNSGLPVAPSVYETSWTLRLATLYGISVPRLSRARAVSWLDGVIVHPEAPADALPPLERVWLATHALVCLRERPSPTGLQSLLAQLRRGPQFSWQAGRPTTWSATQAAVEVMQMAGIQVPADIGSAVLSNLPAAFATVPSHSYARDQILIDEILPLWELADHLLDWSARHAFASELRDVVAWASTRAGSSDASLPFAASLLFQAREVAQANGIDFPTFPQPPFAKLTTADGYLSLSSDQPVPDPQLTYYGALFGLHLSSRLADSITMSAGPTGWGPKTGAISITTSFFAILVAHALGDHHHDASLRSFVRRGLEELARQPLPSNPLANDLTSLCVVLLLAHELELAIPRHLANDVSVLVNSPGNDRDPTKSLWLLRLADVSKVQQPSGPAAAVQAAALTLVPYSMKDVYWLEEASRLTRNPVLHRKAVQFARKLAFGVAYKFVPQSPISDLLSTAVAIMLVGVPSPPSESVMAPFTTENGAMMLPKDVINGNALSPQSLYLGYALMQRISNREGIFFS